MKEAPANPNPSQQEAAELKDYSLELSAALLLAEEGRSAFYFKKILLILAEIFFYLNFAALLILALCIPKDPITFKTTLGSQAYADTTIYDDDLAVFMIFVKVIVGAVSLLPLIIAILFGSIRRKRNRFNKIYQQLDRIARGE